MSNNQHNEHIGRHRPKTIRERAHALDLCHMRDAQARLRNYPYTARHNADTRDAA